MNTKDTITLMDSSTGTARPPRRSDAVGIEIPVTVHASRTTQSLGKNLPAVHEDTRTVIVLPQGAVVRLTATLVPGETVVLTNRSTGADVLCRVGNVKSQPGIQHYIDLEFIQRAPGFWGPVSMPEAYAVSESPRSIPAAPPATPTPAVPPATSVPSAPPSSTAAVVTMPSPPVSAAPAPNASIIAEPTQPSPLAEDVTAPSGDGAPMNPVTVMRPLSMARPKEPDFSSFAGDSVGASGAPKGLLTAAAAMLLVLVGAAGGYWFYRQQSTSARISALQQPLSAPAAPVTPAPAQPIANTIPSSVPAAPSAAVPEPHTDIVIDAQPPKNIPAPQFPALSRASQRIAAPEAHRAVPIAEIKAPKAKTKVASVTSADPPPMVIGAAENLDSSGSTLLLGSGSGPVAPAANVKPTVGGQLQPPRLITSVQPVYPPTARGQRLQGVVMLDALIDEGGKVVQTDVISGPIGLQAAAQESLRNWRYQPAQLNGKPISVHARVAVRFSLQ